MPEPMVAFPPTRNYRPFTRAHLRQRYGPSNPLYEIVETMISVDVFSVEDDFHGALNADLWTATTNGGTAFVRVANRPLGVIRGSSGATNGQDSRLLGQNEIFTPNRRPVFMGRIGQNSAVTTSKFEFGFVDAVGAGAVLVKDTPTSTATDYAVIVRDTNDDTSVDLVTDGTTDAAGLVAGATGITWTTQTWYDVLIAVNELREVVFYVNGIFGGIRRAGPDATTTLATWVYVQTRDDADRTLDVDFLKAWQERVPFSGNAFTT